ncbi:type II toxin-antitoxin system VapC family toxin [Stappia sp. F7233]|uniref:Ribonuclease VapC n=1 Tax=Stappia albiluteola TaxID=2758565 RepID=A0A839AKK8_9HYPH|nr:type II toxin-antitoxin system VapC family toxin [Stappia albiluteola]MBA5778989.1 type II toxin-antitoxin system VapC family toxin [Stappia albiluteola]
MIAVDTSALMAIVLGEAEADACIAALEAEDELLISAGTVAEALIVAARRNVGEEMQRLIDGLGFEVVSVTPASARRIAQAYARWGKGAHPAALNFGDCFAYEIASERACPLLFVGGDFRATDVKSALSPGA